MKLPECCIDYLVINFTAEPGFLGEGKKLAGQYGMALFIDNSE